MPILERDDRRPRAAQPVEQEERGAQDLSPDGLSVELAKRLGFPGRWPERERRADIGEDLVDLVRKDILHRCSELRPLHLIAVTQVDARERAEHLAERMIAHCES